MPRAKRGNKRLDKRKKLEKLSKGYRGTKSKLYRSMRESVQRALKFAYVGRKIKRGHSHARHILTKKTAKRKRQLDVDTTVSESDFERVMAMLPYGRK